MRKKTPQTEEEYLAAAKARYRKRMRQPGPVGRPSLAPETMSFVHIAVERMKGALTQGRVKKETVKLFEEIHEAYPECTTPHDHTLQQYVKAYLLYRRGGKNALKHFPRHIQRSLDLLPAGIHANVLMGLLATQTPDLMRGPRAQKQADLTKRIRAISSLK